ncbi:AbrB/MazE/SpoVT family DNA-binding domain-containing protein [Candidatus Leptofilum sp.]|uniref:AbrB/MazE/SpoVT family DNA-binding domain-containing protein n=1 Tax=Candidatus Leptofilum sp. TaxID=3241576 RepID=UPI003B5C1EFD
MPSAIVSNKGWVVIPKAYRQKYKIKPGDRVRIIDYGGGLSVVPLPEDPIAALRGLLASEPSLTAALLAERAQEKAIEEGRIE